MRPTARQVAAMLAVPTALAVALVVPHDRAAAAAPVPVRFTAAGDYNATANTNTVLTGIRNAAPDLNLALGDLSYGSTTEEQVWCDYVTARVGATFPFELLAGNHESDGTLDGFIDDFAACLPNRLPGLVGTYGRQWYVDHPAQDPTVRFVMISPGLTFPDGTWSYAAGTPRYQWTASAIDGARAAGIPWVVVGLHKPCISVGQYACDGQNDINNLLVSKKVDLVLNGHEHHYQRSKQLALGAGCPALTVNGYNASCVADADDTLARGAGTVFATVGTGGTPLRNVNTADTEAGYFRAFSGANRSPSYGFLDVAADATTMTARFTPTTGGFTDTFTIGSGTPPPNQPPTAAIGVTCTGLTCAFDGSGSTDPDGTVASHAWTFGDGGTATGVRPSRTYAAAGTYTVGLTVTDDDGATGSTTRQVTVTAGTPAAVATDTFSRTLTGGFGTAEAGGAWTVSGSAADASVSGGTGRLVLRTPGQGQLASLPAMTRTSRGDLAVTRREQSPHVHGCLS
jgi:PKD repeat protein